MQCVCNRYERKLRLKIKHYGNEEKWSLSNIEVLYVGTYSVLEIISVHPVVHLVLSSLSVCLYL